MARRRSASSATCAPPWSCASSSPSTTLIVTADGTGGTHAGLVAGWGDHDAVLGVDVGTRPDLDDVVPREAAAAAALGGPAGAHRHLPHRPRPLRRRVRRPDARLPRGARPRRRVEGLLLDPVYSGKAMAGLITAIRDGRVPDDGTIVFLATGGLPALLTPRYTDWVTGLAVTERPRRMPPSGDAAPPR